MYTHCRLCDSLFFSFKAALVCQGCDPAVFSGNSNYRHCRICGALHFSFSDAEKCHECDDLAPLVARLLERLKQDK